MIALVARLLPCWNRYNGRGKIHMDAAVTSYLDAHSSDAQSLLERLCRQPSIAAQNVGIVEMADLVESLLRDRSCAM